MIHLDTNALIALPHWARDGHPAIARIAAGEAAAISIVAWYEFLIGPISDQEIALAFAFVRGNLVALETEDTRLAADLYNQAGRRRTLKTDALIAATAIRAKASLLTINAEGFRLFVPLGLELTE